MTRTAQRTAVVGVGGLLLAAYRDKYGSGFPDPVQNPVFTVHPQLVFGVIEREEQFTTTATRWAFPS